MREDLNKVLGQLEEDLKSMKSAKVQVDNVISSNQQYIGAAKSLIVSTQSLIEKIEKTKEEDIKEFTEKLIRFEDAVNKVSKYEEQNKDLISKTVEVSQKLTAIDNGMAFFMSKMESNLKAQRLQFIILLAVVIVFGVVLLLK
jgi:chromosome segregation ATPase